MSSKKLTYKNEWYRWASNLPGKPVIHVEESTEAGGLIIYFHKQHRRLMKYENIIDIRPPGVMIYFVQVSHKALKKFKEPKPETSSYYYGGYSGYIAGDYYEGTWD